MAYKICSKKTENKCEQSRKGSLSQSKENSFYKELSVNGNSFFQISAFKRKGETFKSCCQKKKNDADKKNCTYSRSCFLQNRVPLVTPFFVKHHGTLFSQNVHYFIHYSVCCFTVCWKCKGWNWSCLNITFRKSHFCI